MAPWAADSRSAIPWTLSSFSALGIRPPMESAPAAQHARAHGCLGRYPSDCVHTSGITLPPLLSAAKTAYGMPAGGAKGTSGLRRLELDVPDAGGVDPDPRSHGRGDGDAPDVPALGSGGLGPEQ